MKNEEKYKTIDDRSINFGRYCVRRMCSTCECYTPPHKDNLTKEQLDCRRCQFVWLDLEAEE